MLSPPSLSPVLVTLMLDRVAVRLPEAEMAFSSALVELKSPPLISSSVVIVVTAE